MSAYLVTSRGGVDKTTVCGELQRRGLQAFDSDSLPGLARWEDSLFKKVFVLTVDPVVHRERLATRYSEYGKHPDMQDALIAEQQKFTAQAIATGGIAIDATQPLAHVVDEILNYAT